MVTASSSRSPDGSNAAAYSSDGITWTDATMPGPRRLVRGRLRQRPLRRGRVQFEWRRLFIRRINLDRRHHAEQFRLVLDRLRQRRLRRDLRQLQRRLLDQRIELDGRRVAERSRLGLVTYGNGVFVAVAFNSATAAVATSFDRRACAGHLPDAALFVASSFLGRAAAPAPAQIRVTAASLTENVGDRVVAVGDGVRPPEWR